jgi:hypothetical protein
VIGRVELKAVPGWSVEVERPAVAQKHRYAGDLETSLIETAFQMS